MRMNCPRDAIFASTLFAASVLAQQPDPLNSPLSAPPPPPTAEQKRLYRDLDLLRRGGFAEAEQATVSLRIADRNGIIPTGLTPDDFQLIVNGTKRSARLQVPGTAASAPPPMVLLVLPPNQPIVHSIALRNARKYFAAQPAELLPWNVGIFDANGTMSGYTNGRTQLLANLQAVQDAPEPFQFTSSFGMRSRDRWDGPWLSKAEEQIALMQKFAGPKIVLAINPIASTDYGLNDAVLAHDGPLALVDVAERTGAHIYIANVGGPDVIPPDGEINASHDHLPSYHMQVDPAMVASLARSAYNTSGMMQAAADTFGGFSNSLDELAGKIHRDLDGLYSLVFDLTPADTDKGVPTVQVNLVRPERRSLKLAVLDVEPVVATSDAKAEASSRALLTALRKSSISPAASPDFRITQHVDYFPLRGGLEPVLPMACTVEWIGAGQPPRRIALVEDVENPDMAKVILERAVEARWDGKSLSWERDGRLSPGNYLWRVAVVEGSAVGEGRKILSSSQETVRVGFPRHEDVAASSLIVGKGCRPQAAASGLQHRPAAGTKSGEAQAPIVDPMLAADCRLKPEATDTFTAADTLRAFVRIYPVEKLEKHGPAPWTAHFALLAGAEPPNSPASGPAEAEMDVPFSVDSGSGYLASIAFVLNAPLIRPGPHVLSVSVRGVGLKGALVKTRKVRIAAAAQPAVADGGSQTPSGASPAQAP